MPYFLVYGLLALWLLPSASMAAGEPVAQERPQQAVPSDYPEDFSRPDALAQAPDYTEAFGEDEPAVATRPPAQEDLMRPFEAPKATPAPAPAQTP